VLGQVSVDPNVTPVLNNGGWVFNAAQLLALLAILLTLAIVFGYMRLAPRFQTDEQTRRSVRVPRRQPGQEVRRPVKVIGTPVVVQPPVVAQAVAAAPAPSAVEHAEVSLDQETFDRVLAELLEKGTDRRVAEGQARRAAMIAARKKAEG
jgi:ABC-type Fe3+ transport system permease subunit